MAFVPLSKMGSAGLVMSGWGRPYMKSASYPKGYNPEHLKTYQTAFTTASRDCSAATKGMTGMERARAKAKCMSTMLKRG